MRGISPQCPLKEAIVLKKHSVFLSLAISAAVYQGAAAAEQLAPASRWIPDEALIALEVTQPRAILDLVLDPKVVTTVTSLPAYEAVAKYLLQKK